MKRRRRGLRLFLLLAVGVVTVGLAGAAYLTEALERLELDSVDRRFELRGAQSPPNDIVVVQIDDLTFGEINRQWPFPRSMHGRAIDRLSRAGARAIAYDVQFTEASEPDEDFALFEAVRRAGNVVLGTSEVDEKGKTNVLGGEENLRAARARAGSVQYDPGAGGVIRRVPYESEGLKTLAVQTVERASGRPVDPDRFGSDGAWIDFLGPPGTVHAVSFSRLLSGRVEPRILKDAIVVVGASAPSLQDVHATSTSGEELMPGPEIQANAISTVRRGLPLRDAPIGIDLALIALLALVAPLASLRLSGLGAVAAAGVAGAALLAGAQLAFNEGTVIAVVYPLGALAMATFGSLVVHYVTEVRERRRTKAAFSRYVPESVADRVLSEMHDGLRLGGEEVVGTVLFSDVRGFTTFSEVTPADQVIEILNRYLAEMTDAILSHEGTLISYLGDGILAVFGAPIAQADHADRALEVAREMAGPRLERFNEWAREHGVPDGFQIGVGMNSGTFMAGNVGSDRRLEYTVIGDTVNTAARMEGMTKGSGYPIFLADSTRDALTRPAPDLTYVDEFPVRGRTGTMRVWGIAAPGSTQAPAPPASPDDGESDPLPAPPVPGG